MIPVSFDEDQMDSLLSGLLLEAIRHMFIKTGRYNQYSLDIFTFDEETGVAISMDYDLETDEYEYVLLYAKCGFLRKVQTLVNNIVGYTTDALSVTNADKPFQYLASSIAECEKELRKIFYSMVRYTIL